MLYQNNLLLVVADTQTFHMPLHIERTNNEQKTPVDWWENQHTVWGEVRDEKSLKVVESSYDLPAHMSGMRMLDQEIEFALELF